MTATARTDWNGQTHNPVDDSYNWDPTDYGSKDQIVGVETCLFTETIATDEALDYMIYPRVLGHAEIGWTAKEDRSWDEYKTRLATHDARLELQGIGYKRDSMIWYNPVNFRMPMDEGSGTKIDAASGPYSGTMNGGVSWTEGKYGTALHLDGTSGYIDIGAPDVQDEWTIGMWVNREAAEGNNAALISGTQGELKVEQYKDTKKVGVTKYGEVDAAFDYELPEGEWVHLTFTGNSEGVNLYVNGEYSGHLDVVMNGPANRIGANSQSGLADMGYMKGSVDDLQIYNSVLSEEEIAEMMEDPYGFGEEAYWTMNEGEGETITDESGQNTGTLTNVGWGEGQEGSALQFSGEGYVDLGYRDAIGDWTIGMWVKAGDTVGTNAVLVSSSVSEIKLDQWNKTGKVGITEAGVADYTFDYSAPKGEWVHLTFVGDSNGTTLYVNGEEQDHLDATIDGPMSRLGASSGSSITGYLNGSLDDVRFYTRALSADEVAEIAQVPTDDETASEVAIAALQTMVDKAVALGSDDETLNAAIANAQAVLAKEAPTATEVVTALLDLSEAMQALNANEGTDALREDVQATIDFINENILNDVEGLRLGKVQALRDAVAAAQNVVDNPDASADALKAANKAMTKAAQELWEIVAKAELEALIEAANGYLDGNYTAESLEALQTAIESAQAVAGNDDATTAEVTEAITNLSNAIAGLVEEAGVDKSALAYEIELVNEMLANIDNYVPSSVEGLADKLAAAQQVYDDANAAQDAVDAATQALREARLNARTKADVSALEELVAYINSLDLRAYTAESAEPVQVLAKQANEMLANAEISQDEVDALAEELQSAIDELQPVSDAAITMPGNDKTDSTTAESTNTAAADMSGMMIALMAAAGAAAAVAYRRKRS